MANDTATYAPSVILVTGGAGFIASHVVRRLLREYPHYRVVVLDKLDYCSSLRGLEDVPAGANLKIVKGDVQSMDLVAYVLRTEAVDTVMHFAAQTHVDNSFGNSLAFTMNNTLGTHVLLEAVRMTGGAVRRFINVSTDEVYGETSVGRATGLAERSLLDPTNPYSAAKAGAEMLCKAYATSYGLPIITTRGNNVYGPGQFPEKLVPKFTLLAVRGEPLPVHGAGDSVRSYLYVDDVAEAFDCILHRGVAGEVYNIGTDEERTVLQVAHDVAAAFDLDPAQCIAHVRDRAFNDRRYYIGSDKLRQLGWRQRTHWADGLRRTLAWYQAADLAGYWQGDVAAALRAHPEVRAT